MGWKCVGDSAPARSAQAPVVGPGIGWQGALVPCPNVCAEGHAARCSWYEAVSSFSLPMHQFTMEQNVVLANSMLQLHASTATAAHDGSSLFWDGYVGQGDQCRRHACVQGELSQNLN